MRTAEDGDVRFWSATGVPAWAGSRMICTAVVQQRGSWWIGWIQEVPGVNGQARTREDLLDNLGSALAEALAMNRADALAAMECSAYEEVRLHIAA